MGLGGSGANQKRRPRPRLPITRTPSTPSAKTPQVVTPTPTPTPPPRPPPNISDITIELEQLHIDGKRYQFRAEDLQDKGHLGEGAFGTVSKMLFTQTNTMMAVKKIAVRELRINDRSDIVELAVIMKTGVCPFIVVFYGCLVRDGDVWICMELMDSSMDKISEKVYNQLNQRIPEDILGKMTVAVIKALNYLKSELSIIHRDVKPSNILVSKTGEIKLCDFGISGRLVDSIAKTMEVGCRPYMAPERIDPIKAEWGYTIQSDVWSFGITLLELALGSFPYGKWSTIFEQLNAVVNGPPPKLPVDGRYSKEIQEFASACLTKDNAKRPNYHDLQQFEFFKKYDKAQVDVASWLLSVMSPPTS